MRFRLTYDGPLRRGNATTRLPIREALHPQLKELWSHQPLSIHRDKYLSEVAREGDLSVLKRVGAHVYAPLVCSSLALHADLDILMLRPEPPGRVIAHGDIDNRLKVLFDALRAPNSDQEIGVGA